MNYKTKSLMYFASLVLALFTYYHFENNESNEQHKMADNIVIEVSNQKVLN